MPFDAEMYRKFANDCIDRAQSARDDDVAGGFVRLAQFWLAKADSADRTADASVDLPSTGKDWSTRLAEEFSVALGR